MIIPYVEFSIKQAEWQVMANSRLKEITQISTGDQFSTGRYKHSVVMDGVPSINA